MGGNRPKIKSSEVKSWIVSGNFSIAFKRPLEQSRKYSSVIKLRLSVKTCLPSELLIQKMLQDFHLPW